MVWLTVSVLNLRKCVIFLEWYDALDLRNHPLLVVGVFFVLLVVWVIGSTHSKCGSSSSFDANCAFLWMFFKAFNPDPVLPVLSSRPDHVERALKTRYHDAMSKLAAQNKELDLLIVILPDNNGSLYGNCVVVISS